MNKTWLLFDCNFLCHRAFHAVGHLSFNEVKTGVLYGFFSDIQSIQEEFGSSDVVFCFDHGRIGVREKMFSGYKAKRKAKYDDADDEEIEARRELLRQVDLLKTDYLSRIGYRNVFYQTGYEADDMIASVAKTLPDGDEAIIITADEDMYQLITDRVMFYNPNKKMRMSLQKFKDEYGIDPSQFWKVKCIAGCSTDDVPGIRGVGERTAIKYLKGELPETAKTYQSIKAGRKVLRRNKPLVKLPFKRTARFKLIDDDVDLNEWEEVCKELGFNAKRRRRVTRKGFLNV